MNETRRFLINVDSDWKVTVTCAKRNESWGREGPMRRLPAVADAVSGQFPLPPQAELPQPDEPGYDLCTAGDASALLQFYRQIIARAPSQEGMKRFGNYLFHSLIGPRIWNSILEASDETGVELIELALSWRKAEHYLHRLNWEMMYAPDGFVARGHPKVVAITRIVAPEPGQETPIARQINPPPRVLFVIGAPLTDPNIRPGAEYYSLLRQLHSKKMKRSIHSFVIQGTTPERGASPEQLAKAMASFRPDVVHFICHGNFNAKIGHGYLILDLDRNETDRERYANHLLRCLCAGGEYPPIVVLSACYSGTSANAGEMLTTDHAAPLAAELVAGGVPVVIGMGGRISDRACRSFTRGFGEALVEGKALVTATAKGRLAAFAEGPLPDRSVDWAFPSVFMAQSTDSGYVPVKMTATDQASVIEERIEAYHLVQEPVFCGREEFFQAYYDIFQEREKEQPTLLISTKGETHGLGRKRLLHELVGQAIRDGHIPVLLSAPSPGVSLPLTVGQFGIALLKAIADARRVFNLELPLDSALLKLLHFKHPIPDFEKLKLQFSKEPDLLFGMVMAHCAGIKEDLLKKEEVKPAIQIDLAALIQAARQKYPQYPPTADVAYPPAASTNRAVVFLERVDQYGEELQTTLLVDLIGGVGSIGLGTMAEPVPVVITAHLTRANAQLHQWIQEKAPRGIRCMDLNPLQQNGEDLLAYERVMLHPSEKRHDIFPGISNIPWAVNNNVEKSTVIMCQKFFRNLLKGIPRLFAEGDTLYGLVDGARQCSYLIEANDEEILRDLLNRFKP